MLSMILQKCEDAGFVFSQMTISCIAMMTEEGTNLPRAMIMINAKRRNLNSIGTRTSMSFRLFTAGTDSSLRFQHLIVLFYSDPKVLTQVPYPPLFRCHLFLPACANTSSASTVSPILTPTVFTKMLNREQTAALRTVFLRENFYKP